MTQAVPDDMVVFTMPDGSLVSNDQRFDLQTALEEQLASRPNTGDVGIKFAEQQAQTQIEHPATLNSGVPGVGENAVPDDVQDYVGNMGTDAQQKQTEDVEKAADGGFDMTNTATKDADPVDSNAEVLAVRQADDEERARLQKARDELGEDGEGDPDVPKAKWTVVQLKVAALQRNAEREPEDELDLSGITKKKQLVALLEEDDAKYGTGPSTGDDD